MDENFDTPLTETEVLAILGKPRYNSEKYEGNEYAGVVTGLAWTAVGGTILKVESSISQGTGKVSFTGNLGEVMKESVSVAMNYIKANADKLNIKVESFTKWDLHVHFPEGATPKDGPSAGITLVTALVSALTQRKVKSHLAMTGEITLRGKVLPVGGIKEKILAAKRAGIKDIILSVENQKDIDEIKAQYIQGLTFHYVDEILDVLKVALLDQKVKGAKAID
jgi:ATP-dependent Lon protease